MQFSFQQYNNNGDFHSKWWRKSIFLQNKYCGTMNFEYMKLKLIKKFQTSNFSINLHFFLINILSNKFAIFSKCHFSRHYISKICIMSAIFQVLTLKRTSFRLKHVKGSTRFIFHIFFWEHFLFRTCWKKMFCYTYSLVSLRLVMNLHRQGSKTITEITKPENNFRIKHCLCMDLVSFTFISFSVLLLVIYV